MSPRYHAGIVIRNALFRLPAKVDYRALPWVTYTDPELAQVGLTEADGARRAWRRSRGAALALRTRTTAPRPSARRTAWSRCVTRRNGRVLGASILGAARRRADPALGAWRSRSGLKIGAMAELIVPYPTCGEAGKRAAGSFYTPKLFSARTRRVVRLLARFG